MTNQYIPTNSVEFETLTTIPEWGNTKDNDPSDYVSVDEKGSLKKEYYKILGYFTQDERLGNLLPRYHDHNFIWSYLASAGQILLLRDGAFKDVFVSFLLPSVSILETSQSMNMAFRRNSRTMHQQQTYEEKSSGSGVFGKKKTQGY